MKRSNPRTDQVINPSGSPQSGEPVYLTIGKIRRSHGVKGELLMEVETDFPERIKSGLQVYIGDEKKEYTIASIRPASKQLLISFEGFDDCDVVAIFRNKLVFIKQEHAMPLPEGSFYRHEVIGMQVTDETGGLLGSVTEIIVTGANDVYVVKTPSGDEILLPAIKTVILKIDRTTNSIIARPQEWA